MPETPTSARTQFWRKTILPLPIATYSGAALAINNSDMVAGYVVNLNDTLAAVWMNGQVKLLPAPPKTAGWDNFAVAVNDAGVVVGYASKPVQSWEPRSYRMWKWSSIDGLTEEAPYPLLSARPVAINGKGTIVGYCPGLGWFTLRKDGLIQLLPDANSLYDVNDSGIVVGSAGDPSRAARWTPDGSLHYLGGLAGPYSWGIAEAVSKQGYIVGSSKDAAGTERAAFFILGYPLQGALDLGLPPDYGDAYDISDRQRIIGVRMLFSTSKALRYTMRLGVLTDLGYAAENGYWGGLEAVNDCGTIAGSSEGHPVLWKPTFCDY